MFTFQQSISALSSHRKEIFGFVSAVFTFMLLVSLFSHNPTDPSWFYLSTHPHSITNWCGLFGAQLSGLLFFLFGLSAYVLTFFMGYFFYWLSTGGSVQKNWERLLAGAGVVMAISTLCNLYRLSLVPGAFYGGYVGFYSSLVLHSFFDQIGSLLIVYVVLHASLVVLFRFSFVVAAQMLLKGSLHLYQVAQKHRIAQKGYAAFRGLLVGSFYMMKRGGKIFFNLLDGSAARDAQYEDEALDFFKYASLEQKSLKNRLIESNDPESSVKPQRVSFARKVLPLPAPQQVEEENSIEEIEESEEFDFQEPSQYGLPSNDIFIGIAEKKEDQGYRQELEERAKILEEKLERFGVFGNVVSIKSGPVVTLFEYQPNIDTKISKILSLEDDLALALEAHSIRILAPIPGRSVVGFEVSNTDRKDVLFSDVVQSEEYEQFEGSLPLILGKDTIGNNIVVDLAQMPHLLIAGSTGSGKSVALNGMLISLLCKRTPDELKMVLIDPKRLEFASYADIAHLLFPIITEPKKSIPVLKWVVQEMDSRYERMAKFNARNVFDYNNAVGKDSDLYFPNIVVVIDELSDLMMTVGREIEDLIARITQMARAAGIHMIVATQRPSVDVITGLIKVNFPSRISFRVTSKVDSRTILDCGGADKLLGRGDMLFLDSTASILKRIHGAYVSNKQIEMVVSHIRSQRSVDYLDISQHQTEGAEDMSNEDELLLDQVITYLAEIDEVSISLLQRKFRIGYNRSARLIDILEARGHIMPADGGKTRRVIR